MDIIGISGKFGVGKTTIANYIVDMLDGWQTASFADLIKQETAREFQFDPRLAYSKEGKETLIHLPDGNCMTIRDLLQWYGTDVVRAKDPDYWVRAMVKHLAFIRNVIPGIVIDDVRFPNEANRVRVQKGLLVQIAPYPGYIPSSEHISETALDNYLGFALVIRPDFGEEHLRKAAEEIVRAAQAHLGL
jgi:hypothetical protein